MNGRYWWSVRVSSNSSFHPTSVPLARALGG
jgi:hypothetical protein